MVIVLELPNRNQLRFDDAEARNLADRLWELARERRGSAMLAVAIDAELRRRTFSRQPIEVSAHAMERLSAVLGELRDEPSPTAEPS